MNFYYLMLMSGRFFQSRDLDGLQEALSNAPATRHR